MNIPMQLSGKMPDFKIQKAIEMREKPTKAEESLILICREICEKYSDRFGVQVPMLGYILDAYFHVSKICVEADGGYHASADQRIKDAKRDSILSREGVLTIRLRNELILECPGTARNIIEKSVAKSCRKINQPLTIHQKYAIAVRRIERLGRKAECNRLKLKLR